MTLRKMNHWQDQLARVRRWRDRLSRQEERDTGKRLEYEDFLWAFFQNAWHLKDWIRGDKDVAEEVRGRVEELFNGSTPLSICADLANRGKHNELRKHCRCDATMPRSVCHVTIHRSRSGDTRQRMRWDYWVITKDGNKLKALALADEVIQEIETILKKLGLDSKAGRKGP